MFKKIKELVTHPYAAPAVETVKGVGEFAFQPLGGFIERIKEGLDDDTYYSGGDQKDKPKLLRIYKRLFYTDDSAGFISFFGSLLTGIAGGAVAGVAAFSGGAGWLGITGAVAAAVGVGAAAGPFLLAGVIAAGTACVGSIIGGLPGLMKGCKIANDHRKFIKAHGQVAQVLPTTQAQDEELTKALAKALSPFNDLQPAQRDAYVKMMNEQHQGAVRGQSDKLLQALDSLPEKERDALLKGLRPRLKEEFDGLATREANDSTILQKEIEVAGPIRLKIKPANK